MNIRFMGSADLIKRIANLTNKRAKLHPNRGSDDLRLFIDLDDCTVEQWLDLLENAETTISIDPKDFQQRET